MEELGSRLRAALDVVTTLTMLGAAATVIWVAMPRNTSTAPQPPVNPGLAVNDRLEVPGLTSEGTARKPRLVIFLRSTCRFCTASMPFYRRVAASNPGLEIVTVSDEPVPVLTNYLTEHGVKVDRLQRLSEPVRGIRGTPTLVLVDRDSIVRGVWSGQLQPEREAEVLAAMNAAVQ